MLSPKGQHYAHYTAATHSFGITSLAEESVKSVWKRKYSKGQRARLGTGFSTRGKTTTSELECFKLVDHIEKQKKEIETHKVKTYLEDCFRCFRDLSGLNFEMTTIQKYFTSIAL